MIDWLMVAAIGSGTFGGAVLLYSWSCQCWLAYSNGTSLRGQLTKPSWGMAIAVGMGLICLGFALGALPRWEAAFWAGLSLLWAWRSLQFAFSR